MNYTKKLDELKTGHRKKVAAIRADEDLKPEARDRRIQEETQRFEKEYREEKKNTFSSLDSDIEQTWKRAHAEDRPSGSNEEQVARELRLQRIREEVRDDFESGRRDPLRDYERAVRLGDSERAEVIGKMGGRYLSDGFRRSRLAELVQENEPASKKQARQRLQALETEKRQTELGLALQERARSRR